VRPVLLCVLCVSVAKSAAMLQKAERHGGTEYTESRRGLQVVGEAVRPVLLRVLCVSVATRLAAYSLSLQ
jgi:hypothetical protein